MFECQIHFAKVPCQVSGLLSFSSVEFRCPNISNYTDRLCHLTQHFFRKILQLLSYSGLGKKFGTGRSLSLNSVWKERLDFSCHTTPECCNCLVFFSRQTLIVRTSEMFTLIVILCLFFHGQQPPPFFPPTK